MDAAESPAELLHLSGHEVRVAHSGLAAVMAAVEFRPQTVILDIGLPGMEGYAVARALRARPGGKDLVIVPLSSYGQEEDRRRSREPGCDAHLVKPMNVVELEKVLAESGGG